MSCQTKKSIFNRLYTNFLKIKNYYATRKSWRTRRQIWSSLNENGAQTLKQIKKTAKITEKDFYLGLGWLLREDKVNANEVEDGETTFELK